MFLTVILRYLSFQIKIQGTQQHSLCSSPLEVIYVPALVYAMERDVALISHFKVKLGHSTGLNTVQAKPLSGQEELGQNSNQAQ